MRHTARRGRQAFKVELPEIFIVGGHFALALTHADGHGGLVVVGGGKNLRLFGRNGRVAVNQTGENTAQRFNAKRQGRHVQQQHILDVALQNTGLNCGTHGDHFIGVHAHIRLLAEYLFHKITNARHARLPANQNDLVNFAGRHAGIFHRIFAGFARALHQLFHHCLKRCARQLEIQMFRARRIGCDKGQVHFCLARRRQFNFGLFGGLFQALKRQLVATQINAVFLLKLLGQMVDKCDIEVFAAQECVAIGRFDLEHAVANLKN